jgi:streptomycin 6-kinase
VDYPDLFKEKIIGCFGDEGKQWLPTLNTLVQTYAEKWNLTVEGPVTNLSYNYVLKAKDSEGRPVILKLGIPNFDFKSEIRTLESYNGQGCAKLLKADPEFGAMLLEQLLPGTMLSDVENEVMVVEHYTKVWRAIRRPLPNAGSTPSIMDWASGLERYRKSCLNGDMPIPMELVNLAEDFFHEITETSAGPELLHGDLHHENILLSDEHGWMAIDPKGVSGDPYFDLISFLVNHLITKTNPKDLLKLRIDLLCRFMKLDRERLLKAAVAMGTLYACWGVEDNDEDWKNTYQCVEWFQELRNH